MKLLKVLLVLFILNLQILLEAHYYVSVLFLRLCDYLDETEMKRVAVPAKTAGHEGVEDDFNRQFEGVVADLALNGQC